MFLAAAFVLLLASQTMTHSVGMPKETSKLTQWQHPHVDYNQERFHGQSSLIRDKYYIQDKASAVVGLGLVQGESVKYSFGYFTDRLFRSRTPVCIPYVEGDSSVRNEHIKEHLQEMTLQQDVNEMPDKELEFYYFKMHDNDGNNKLDGCELIKSVIHWHVEQSQMMGTLTPSHRTSVLTDSELSMLVNPILDFDDMNRDGFIDYVEFVAAQKSRGF